MRRKDYNGFTIIEVSLVVAIAGLILLMVFIALPTLQRQARDAERRDDVLTFVSKLKSFQASNNRGALPSGGGSISGDEIFSADYDSYPGGTWEDFYQKFFTDSFSDPSYGAPYAWDVSACSGKLGQSCENINTNLDSLSSIDGTMYILTSASCNGSEAVRSANARNVAALIKLEGGGVFCANT